MKGGGGKVGRGEGEGEGGWLVDRRGRRLDTVLRTLLSLFKE